MLPCMKANRHSKPSSLPCVAHFDLCSIVRNLHFAKASQKAGAWRPLQQHSRCCIAHGICALSLLSNLLKRSRRSQCQQQLETTHEGLCYSACCAVTGSSHNIIEYAMLRGEPQVCSCTMRRRHTTLYGCLPGACSVAARVALHSDGQWRQLQQGLLTRRDCRCGSGWATDAAAAAAAPQPCSNQTNHSEQPGGAAHRQVHTPSGWQQGKRRRIPASTAPCRVIGRCSDGWQLKCGAAAKCRGGQSSGRSLPPPTASLNPERCRTLSGAHGPGQLPGGAAGAAAGCPVPIAGKFVEHAKFIFKAVQIILVLPAPQLNDRCQSQTRWWSHQGSSHPCSEPSVSCWRCDGWNPGAGCRQGCKAVQCFRYESWAILSASDSK